MVVQDSEGISVLELDDAFLYWAAGTLKTRDDESGRFTIRRRSGDGTVEDVATVEGWIHGLAKHLNRLYWTVQRPRNDPVTGQIMTMEMPNGPITVLEVEWPREIVVNGTRAYWTDFQAGVFSAAVVDGLIEGPPRYFAGWENAVGIADHDQTLFWTQMNLDNSIRYTEKSNPGGFGIIACNQQWPETIAVDGERIYWPSRHIENDTGRLMVVARGGGLPKVLLDDRPVGVWSSIESSPNQLYWVERETVIMRMTK
jgi:hypothetical protein